MYNDTFVMCSSIFAQALGTAIGGSTSAQYASMVVGKKEIDLNSSSLPSIVRYRDNFLVLVLQSFLQHTSVNECIAQVLRRLTATIRMNLTLEALTPRLPFLEGVGCKKAGSRETQITKTQFTAYIFHEKTAKNGRFWSKIEFFGLRQAFEDPPPISRVLDAKKQVLGRHRSRKHNLQHAYAPKFTIFHEKNGQKWLFFGQKLSFF